MTTTSATSSTSAASGLTLLQQLTAATNTGSGSSTTGSTSSSSSTSSATAGAGGNAITTAAQEADTFLKLLVAQMNNQDPLQPVDNSQVTTQMAQISTVEGIQQLNTTLSASATQSGTLAALNSAGMIGHQALVPGNTLTLPAATSGTATTPVTGGYNLSTAGAVQINILDSTGAVVATQNVASANAGVNTFQWDGTTASGSAAPAGNYTFNVSSGASASALQPVTSTYSAGTITAVTSGSTGTNVEIGGSTQYQLSDVHAIL